MLVNIVNVLVTASGEVYKDGAALMLSGIFDGVCQGVAAFDSRNDALVAAEEEESFDCLIVKHGDVIDTSEVVQIGVLRTEVYEK